MKTTLRDHHKPMVEALVKDIESRGATPNSAYEWPAPALNVIDCVLSLNRQYELMVKPRVEAFAIAQPNVVSIADLQERILSFDSPHSFGIHDLDYNDVRRMTTLLGVVERMVEIVDDASDEQKTLEVWAMNAKPGDYAQFGVKHFALAGFQYMRMLFKAPTVKPDVQIIGYVESVVGGKVSPMLTILLLEEAARIANVNVRDLDYLVWDERQSGPKNIKF